MVRRTKEEALETRNRILDAAEDVFYARGVARTSASASAAASTMKAVMTLVSDAICTAVSAAEERSTSPVAPLATSHERQESTGGALHAPSAA